MRLGKYLKSAFLNHWNLLAVIGGTVFSFLTGRPDVALPIVAAGEIAYLGLLGTHPKFQKYVDAQDAKARRQEGALSSEEAFSRIRKALPSRSLDKYEALRRRCLELRQIASDMRHPGARGKRPFEDLQLQGLDRLLWIYLRLLYTEHALSRFFEQTRDERIEDDIERLEARLAAFDPEESNPRRLKARAAIEDNLRTSRARLANLQKARENQELVELEIDRLETKIRSLSELAINRQEPDFISDQVDAVAESMLETERTMSELDFATGFSQIDEAVPDMLAREPQKIPH